MQKSKVLIVMAGVLVFFVAIRVLFHPRPVVFVLSFPYGFLAASAVSSRFWLKLRTRLHPERRTSLPEAVETR
jgi:hypothetical protein